MKTLTLNLTLKSLTTLLITLSLLLTGCATTKTTSSTTSSTTSAPVTVSIAQLQQQVMAAERAFAKSMADRDLAAFTSFLSEEAVFISKNTKRGKQAVADHWAYFFEKPQAPFSWAPETVEVLESGTIALSTGPVRRSNGEVFNIYTSVWRLEAPGVWRVILDKGNKFCQ